MKCHRPRYYHYPIDLAADPVPIVDRAGKVICWAPDRESSKALAGLIRAHLPEGKP